MSQPLLPACPAVAETWAAIQAEGDPVVAEAMVRDAMVRHPAALDIDHRPLFLAQGLALLLRQGKPHLAQAWAREALGSPTPTWWTLLRAREAFHAGNVPEAVAAYRQFNALEPEIAEPFECLALLATRHLSTIAAEALVEMLGGERFLSQPNAADLARVFSMAGDHVRAARLDVAAHGPRCRILQSSSDGDGYFDMLLETSRANREYARRQGAKYEFHVGVQQGYHPWHATLNRICLLRQMLQDGYYGWVLYLDTDAYIADLDFDLWGWLAANEDVAMVAAAAGTDAGEWDINSGVLLLNLADPRCQTMVTRWHERSSQVLPPSVLAENSTPFTNVPGDQTLLHQVLQQDPVLLSGLRLASHALINAPDSRFIRHHIRHAHATFEERMAAIRAGVSAALAASAAVPALAPAVVQPGSR